RKWVSFNYFTLPGFTDQPAEYTALLTLLRRTGAHMIQWRNFNIDPDWYAQRIGITPESLEEPIGVREMMRRLRAELPHLTYGYYNPHRGFIAKHLESFAQAL
ncbi:MAG: hypothetical protein NZ580_04185, partial [Bacteroidia bacterium]|nr:hypothetical protein [Bacteroidia bacterium]